MADFTAREDASALVLAAVVGRERRAAVDVVVKDVEARLPFSPYSFAETGKKLNTTVTALLAQSLAQWARTLGCSAFAG
jgi:hypothetical protein